MKSGKIVRSIERPKEGFSFKREGYKIHISYIEPNSICEIDSNYESNTNKEYQYNYYSYYGSITNYEDLVSKCVLLKYTIESEISLMAKAILDPKNSEYLAYREFVQNCKDECNNIYIELGLTKNEI